MSISCHSYHIHLIFSCIKVTGLRDVKHIQTKTSMQPLQSSRYESEERWSKGKEGVQERTRRRAEEEGSNEWY